MTTKEKVEFDVENGVTTLVHEMKIDGYHLLNIKKKTVHPNLTKVILIKWINDRNYVVEARTS